MKHMTLNTKRENMQKTRFMKRKCNYNAFGAVITEPESFMFIGVPL